MPNYTHLRGGLGRAKRSVVANSPDDLRTSAPSLPEFAVQYGYLSIVHAELALSAVASRDELKE